MIKKLAAVMLLTVATTAKETLTQKEEHPQVSKKSGFIDGTGLDWFVFTMGASLGVTLEAGTNIGASDKKYVQCIGQTSDLLESFYFTYFYIS